MIKHTYDKIPDLTMLTLVAGSILNAGGSGKRMAFWRKELKLNPIKAMTYANRFGGCVENAKYRAANFPVICDWTLRLADEAGLQDANDDDDDEDGGGNDKGPGSEPLSSRIASVARAYRKQDALPTLFLSEGLLGDVPELITQSSAEGSNVPADFIPRLRMLGDELAAISGNVKTAQSVC